MTGFNEGAERTDDSTEGVATPITNGDAVEAGFIADAGPGEVAEFDVAPPHAVPPIAPRSRRPRLWTLFAVIGAATVALVVGQVAVAAAFALYLVVTRSAGISSSGAFDVESFTARLQELILTPVGLILFAAPTQLAFAATAIIAARRSPTPAIDRLGLRAPRLRWFWYPIFALATIVPFAVSIAAAALGAQLQPEDDSVLQIWEHATWTTGILLVLFISVVPGFVEELFYRGYIQRRLIARFGPWIAIFVTSFVFGLFHVMPAAFGLAFTLGIWLGVLAWRTGSIWPGAVCHAAVNGAWNAFQVGGRLLGADMTTERDTTTTDWIVLGTILAVGVVFFVIAIAKLRRCGPTVATMA